MSNSLDDFIDNLIAPYSVHRKKYARPHGTVARRELKNRMNKRLKGYVNFEISKALSAIVLPKREN